ncbi:hypothetical protein WJX81_001739 [Elliptochloris bilobata]|uniref:FAD-binding domain-containing protein n=1 Tax=Elliptochloris bilobata TaxID=381761 RepID=A0AAW1QJY0_9CHLO
MGLLTPFPKGDAQDAVYVVGGGIGGLAAAAGLHKAGIKVVILERSPSLRQSGAAIALQTNAFRALNLLDQGISDTLRAQHPELAVWEYYTEGGRLLKTLHVKDCSHGPHEMRGVVRNQLAAALSKPLPDGTIRLGAGVQSVAFDEHDKATVELMDGTRIPAKIVIGADGVNSKVGAALGIPKPDYAGFCAFRGMANFDEGLPWKEKNMFRFISGAREGLIGVYPVSATEIFYFVAFPAPRELPKQMDRAAQRAELDKRVAGLPFAMPEIARRTRDEDLYFSIITDRLPDPTWAPGRGCTTVIGDALHPTQPTLAQGGCMAIEDGAEIAVVLKRVLAGRPLSEVPDAEIAAALRDFERRRSARCGVLIAQARATGKNRIFPKSFLGAWLRDLITPFAISERNIFAATVWEPSGDL